MLHRINYTRIGIILLAFSGALVAGHMLYNRVPHDPVSSFQNSHFELSENQEQAIGAVTLADTYCSSPLRVVSLSDTAAFIDHSHTLGREVDSKTGAFTYAKPLLGSDTFFVYEYRGAAFSFQDSPHICLAGIAKAASATFTIDAASSAQFELGSFTDSQLAKLPSYQQAATLLRSKLKTGYLDVIAGDTDIAQYRKSLRAEVLALHKVPPTPSPTP